LWGDHSEAEKDLACVTREGVLQEMARKKKGALRIIEREKSELKEKGKNRDFLVKRRTEWELKTLFVTDSVEKGRGGEPGRKAGKANWVAWKKKSFGLIGTDGRRASRGESSGGKDE